MAHTHTTDYYAQCGSKVFPATEHDCFYVLDEELGNETGVVSSSTSPTRTDALA